MLSRSLTSQVHLPFHPTGNNAAPTPSTPLSVASRLYAAAAFPVSITSTLIPSPLKASLVSLLNIHNFAPVPRMSKSGLGYNIDNNPHAFCGRFMIPVLFSSSPILFVGFPVIQGRQVNASPPRRSTPLPPEVLMPLLRRKPSVMQASIEVAGDGVLPRIFKAPKSVCVSSLEGGPRSWVGGGLAFEEAVER